MFEHMDVGLVFGADELMDAKRMVVSSYRWVKAVASTLHGSDGVLEDAFGLLVENNVVPTSTVIVRRDCLKRVGGFDESLQIVEDRDLWLRISRKFGIGYIPVVVSHKRLHGTNLSSDGLVATESLIRVLEKVVTDRDIGDSIDLASVRNRLADLYFHLGYCYIDRGIYHAARQNFRHSLRGKIALRPITYYLGTLLGKRIVTGARRIKQRWS